MEGLELAVITGALYAYTAIQGGGTLDWSDVLKVVALKILAKIIRSNPRIPLPDYVNGAK